MMGSNRLFATIGAACAGLLCLLGLTGCPGGETGCEADQECRGSRLCIQGRCEFPFDDDTGPDADGDTPEPGPDTGWEDTSSPDITPVDSGFRDTEEPDPDSGLRDSGFTDTSEDTRGDIDRPSGPQIRVVPRSEVDFGTLVIGSSYTQSVVLRNYGDESLEIQEVGLRSTPSEGFTLEGPASPTTLSPGESVAYDVTFEPNQQARFENHLDITSDDPDAEDEAIGVTLRGAGFNKIDRPCLFSTPSNLDFGVVRPGNSATNSITVGNCSENDTVTVTEYKWNQNPNDRFSVTSNAPTPPFQLQTGDSEQIPIQFDSETQRSLTAQLEIRSDEQTGAQGDRIDIEASGGGCPEADARGHVPNDDHDRLRDGPVALPVASGRNTVEFDGTESNAPSGNVEYTWSIARRPSDSSQSLSGLSGETTSLSPSTPGIYEVQLEVSDAVSGQQGCTTDIVEVVAIDQTIDAEFTTDWQADHNLDIHVVRSDSGGNFPAFGHRTNDVNAEEIERDWSKGGDRTDNAFHLGNSIPSDSNADDGSEKVIIPNLESDRRYRFAVHFDSPDGFRPPRFQGSVELTVDGTSHTLQKRWTIRNRNQYWITYEVNGRNSDVTEVDRDQ